ncbi:MAG TPA: GNAT family N-acetyltransferase [Anaerolineales bacterium]|nr:GNAT family N-acetyltransferase [Anaerolineales bacterium]
MELIIHENESGFDQLELNWNALLINAVTHSPFLRFEYLRNWWKTKGGGEWHEPSRLLIISSWHNGQLVGIAPFFSTINRDGIEVLALLGSIEISDSLDLIVSPENHELFCSEVWKIILLDDRFPKNLEWYNLPIVSPTISTFERLARQSGVTVIQEVYQPSPTILLPASFDGYLASIDKKQRHEIRRKIRRAEESGRNVRWYITTQLNELNDHINELFRLMALDPKKAVFLTPLMRQQLERCIRTSFDNGYLQLAFLEADGKKVCVYLNFDLDDKIWVYNSGYDREYNDLSVGWVLLGYLIEYAIQLGRKEFDFMRGDEDYKYKFGAINRPVMRLSITK